MFTKQDPMRRVVYSLVPIFLWSVYLYGWRVVALVAITYLLGVLAEFVFEKNRNKKVSEAVLVTSGLLALSLPPGVPMWVAAVGVLFAVIFGKEVYGGFGRNIFNPAITGRTFTYISFPLLMQTTWMFPGAFGMGGINRQILGSTWLEAVVMLALVAVVFLIITKNPGNKKVVIWTSVVAVLLTIAFYVVTGYAGVRNTDKPWTEVDVVTTATPLEIYKGLAQENNWETTLANQGKSDYAFLQDNNVVSLFFGFRIGSIGEGSIFLILIAAIYLLWTKTANWRPMLWTFLSATLLSVILYYTGALAGRFPLLAVKADFGSQLADILGFLMSGSLIYAAVFMSTDPVSAPKKPAAQHIYGFLIGTVTIVIRVFAGFPEGVSFAILTANAFASLIDEYVPAKKKAASAGASAAPAQVEKKAATGAAE